MMLIDHPNLVKQYDYFEDQVNLYIATDYSNGGELFDYVSKVNRLSEKQIAKVIRQLLQSLEYMHKRNLVHSNIKPKNIVLASDAEGDSLNIKLTGFGFAKIQT